MDGQIKIVVVVDVHHQHPQVCIPIIPSAFQLATTEHKSTSMSNQASTKKDYSDLTKRIISCIMKVHSTLGPGFLEGIYHRALLIELKKNGIAAESEKKVPVHYEGEEVGLHRLDILVDDGVILELKTVEQLNRTHYDQLRSYLKATGLNVGLLVNFSKERADFRRIEM